MLQPGARKCNEPGRRQEHQQRQAGEHAGRQTSGRWATGGGQAVQRDGCCTTKAIGASNKHGMHAHLMRQHVGLFLTAQAQAGERDRQCAAWLPDNGRGELAGKPRQAQVLQRCEAAQRAGNKNDALAQRGAEALQAGERGHPAAEVQAAIGIKLQAELGQAAVNAAGCQRSRQGRGEVQPPVVALVIAPLHR